VIDRHLDPLGIGGEGATVRSRSRLSHPIGLNIDLQGVVAFPTEKPLCIFHDAIFNVLLILTMPILG